MPINFEEKSETDQYFVLFDQLVNFVFMEDNQVFFRERNLKIDFLQLFKEVFENFKLYMPYEKSTGTIHDKTLAGYLFLMEKLLKSNIDQEGFKNLLKE